MSGRVANRKADILSLLKERDGASLADLADALGVSKQGALRHLDALREDGLVECGVAEHTGPGRPEHVYHLSAAAADRFLAGHRQLAAELVDFMDQEQLGRFFEGRAARLEVEYSARMAGLTLAERVLEVARMATEHGHMAEVVTGEDGNLAIRHHNCPIADVAGATGHPCQAELGMYGRLLGVEIDRTSWIPDSAPSCTYVIRNTGESPGKG